MFNTDSPPSFIFGLTAGVAIAASAQYVYRLFSGFDSSLPKVIIAPTASQSNNSQQNRSEDIKEILADTARESAVNRLDRLFTVEQNTLHNLVKAFTRDMERGLKQDGTILKMIPSYVSCIPDGTESGSYFALDLGGSNFRVCEYTFLGKGRVRSRHSKFVIPDEAKEGHGDDLFRFIAEKTKAFFEDNEIDLSVEHKLGFTFSFPCTQTDINKGTLITWTKGFSTAGVVGKDVVEYLQVWFIKVGLKIKIVALVNDTVGTLISHAYQDTNTYMGIILGTGNNAAYVERIENISKWHGPRPASGEMIVNMEWGAWGSDGMTLPTTPYDNQVDRASPNPKQQFYEKMISGFYLGELTRYIMIDLISTGELFGGKTSAKLEIEHSFETALMSRIERDHSDELSDTRAIFSSLFDIETTVGDRRLIKHICHLIGTRAARMAAVGVAAVVTKIRRLDGCTIAIDGSLFEFYPHFASRMRDALRELVGFAADHIILEQARDGSGQGAALIAALVEKGKEKF